MNTCSRMLPFFCIVFLAMNGAAIAQEVNKQSAAVEAEAISTVFAFNRICYAQVPDVESIGKMASDLVWQKLNAEELEPFQTPGKTDVLDGWDAQIGQRVYRVAVSQGPIMASQTEIFPDFSEGTTTTCTLALDGLDGPGVVAGDMQRLAAKEPISKDVEKDGLSTTTWAGGNDDLKVFLVSSLGGEKGGLLSVTVLTK